MQMAKVRRIDEIPCIKLGEGPHWLEGQQALVFVDVFSKALRRYFVDSGRQQVLYLDDGGAAEIISMVVPVEGEADLFLVALGRAISAVRWSVGDPDRHTVTVRALHTVTRGTLNDAKCDPRGRLWIGTMSAQSDEGDILEPNTCSLYKYDHDLELTSWVNEVSISNGLAWSHDRKSFYYIDTPAKAIYQFDYDDAAGSISNQRVILDYPSAGLMDQMPDGMAIDVEGNLWVACFGGSQVVCVDPKAGKVVRKVQVPSKNVTSVCWGGKDYSTLYVTSGKMLVPPEEIAALPSTGGTFAITGLGSKGGPPVSFKADLEKLRAKMEGEEA